jgi:four helix bundle protein
MTNDKIKFDLEERTGRFGADVINFAKTLPKNSIINPITSQLIRSATSVGANYCEADDAQSRADFKHKIAICKKEARETVHWLKMVIVADPNTEEKAKKLGQEAKELNLIFNAIIKKTEANSVINNLKN